MQGRQRSIVWLFAGLTVYILAQFVWWAVLLLRHDAELSTLRRESGTTRGPDGLHVSSGSGAVMVLGEASVFLALLLLVMWLTYRAVRRDLRMASAQRNFLLAVTHELRTPIAAVKLQLQTLARHGLDETQRSSLLTTAAQETERLSLLTDKVLMATAGEDGLRLRPERTDVADAIRAAVDQARSTFAQDHVLELRAPQQLHAIADARALRSVLDNLIENAVKYSPLGSRIEVEVESDATTWRIMVSDEGPGIPEKERERIFERFYRAGSEETRERPGTGLGLYIVKQLMDRAHGRISVRRREPHGSIFTAIFPRSS